MTRDEALRWVGKFVCVTITGKGNNKGPWQGFFMLSKNNDGFILQSMNKETTLKVFNENLYVKEANCKIRFGIFISAINTIVDCQNDKGWVPVHECFGHELEGWLSKPIEQFSINLKKYPHICMKCNSPSWNNPVTGHSDCSNKNCK